MPPVPCPREEGGRKGGFLLRAPSRFMGQATDHRTVDAQVGHVAVGQHVQLAYRLAIDRAAGTVFLHLLDRSHQPASEAGSGSGVMGMGDSSHGYFLFSVSCVCAGPGLALGRLDASKMAMMLHVHNGSFGIAAMQHPHAGPVSCAFLRARSWRHHDDLTRLRLHSAVETGAACMRDGRTSSVAAIA